MRLKAGQKVWFINHALDEIREGIVESLDDASGYNEYPTTVVVSERHSDTKYVPNKVLEDEVFTTREDAQISLKREIHFSIEEHREEIKRLGVKLSGLEEEMLRFHNVHDLDAVLLLASQAKERIIRKRLISSF